MNEHRLRAPTGDGALLAVPPLAEVPALLQANAARLAVWDHDFQGRPASRLRFEVRDQILNSAGRYLRASGLDTRVVPESSRLLVTGHQPELFHPGVWIKNFALANLAKRTDSVALNLIVDNDIPKSSALKVPRTVEDGFRIEKVFFDDWAGEIPYEDLKVEDEALFTSFADRVRAVLGNAISDPVIDEFWPRALNAANASNRVGLRFAMARRAVEASWGIHNLEVPLSTVCESEGFQWFACHLFAHLPRFQQVHNEALGRYRSQYGIRSAHHPVPALGRQGEWLEAPFWVWRASRPRRKPLMVRQRSRTIQLRIGGEEETLLELPLGPDREACCAVDQLQELPSRGVRLRTRALTTTMFARYLLGDLFLHGIGGAKYDELGDEISGRFFGIEPPGYLTTSMTLRLGLDAGTGASVDLARTDREIRDLVWNPDRHLLSEARADPEAIRWIDAKRCAVGGPVETHAQRVARFYEIRRCHERLQEFVADRLESARRERVALIQAVEREKVARSREYSLVLHSRQHLREALNLALPGRFGSD